MKGEEYKTYTDKTIKNIGENINNLLVNIKDSEL